MNSYRQFNTPREAAARLAYLVQLAFGVGGFLLLIHAGMLQSASHAAAAVTLLLAAALIRSRLRAGGWLARCQQSLDALGNPDDDSTVEDTEESAHFEALLDQCDELEARRGTAEFDPWALSSLRHQIQATLRIHPEFAPLLRSHARSGL